jgi:hypothetical protein
MAGVILMVSSLPDARMLVRAFFLHTFTFKSPGRWWIPINMFSYT